MALILWLKNSKIARWIAFAFIAIGGVKLIELSGARRREAELKAERNEQRLTDVQDAKQDLQDANEQTDNDLDDRLTRG